MTLMLVYSVALFIIGIIIALVFHPTVGVSLIAVAAVGVVLSLIRSADSSNLESLDVDLEIDEVVRRKMG